MRLPFGDTFLRSQGFNDPRWRDQYTRFGLMGHNGLDYACPAWTPILAPHKGVVREALFDAGGYGNYIKIESPDESSVLAHLAKISVSEGQEVEEGQFIGYSGNSGNSTGPHLHWGYYRTRTRNRANGFNGYIDQTDWLDAITAQITDQTKLDIGDGEIQEWQAIKSIIHDLRRDNAQLRQDLADALTSPQKPPEMPADEEVGTLLTKLIQKLKELWNYR